MAGNKRYYGFYHNIIIPIDSSSILKARTKIAKILNIKELNITIVG